jgi:hypothetical protein
MRKSKTAAQKYRRWMKQFVRDAQGTLECRLVSAEDLLYFATTGPRRPATMPMVDAFHQWSAAAIRSHRGSGPLCLTCNAEFGPGRAVPAAFWVQSPFVKQSSITIISGVCPECFTHADCMDRILAGMRRRIPDLQVTPLPMTRQ